jgi:hypothetical protein
MIKIDFSDRVCPNCGTEDFPILSRETVSATCGISVFGPNKIDWDGYTDIEWQTQKTEYFFCNVCKRPLPKEWQEAIQQALDDNITSLIPATD